MQDDTLSGDVVTEQWIARHGITIPRAAGVFQSESGWVKINGSGVVIGAGEKNQTVLAWLVDRKILCDSDADYGIAYVTCRSAERAYRRQMGFKSSLDLSVLANGGGLSCEQAAKVFCLMRTGLGRKSCEVIEYACDAVHNAETRVKYEYRKAFTALGKAFDQAVQDVRENRVSDEPQPKQDQQCKGLEKILARAADA